jgi:predicted DNA repair protein MutK
MAGSSLLALFDDIATLLDDVAVMSKVAAKNTVGVIGDDLALNAEQVSGVKADRELAVVWAVAKGSLKNKVVLVPAALLISAFVPWLVTILLMIGGLFLCFEGAEKILHKHFHDHEEMEVEHQAKLAAVQDLSVDLVEFEREKIKGAIRTDFILSAEIVIIILGSVATAPFATQVAIVSGLALLITVGVYGVVAGIVKLDDAGLYLLRSSIDSSARSIKRTLGRALLILAPALMKLLSVVGTIAMFLVGGGILLHNTPAAHHWVHEGLEQIETTSVVGDVIHVVGPILAEGITGLIAGLVCLLFVTGWNKVKK